MGRQAASACIAWMTHCHFMASNDISCLMS